MAGSCKSIVQIMELLAERGLSFSFCLHKEEMLILSGFGLLYQGLDLDNDSKLMKDNQKTLASIINILDRAKAPCAPEFRRVACSFLPIMPQPPKSRSIMPLSRHNSDGAMPTANFASIPPALRQHFKAMGAKLMPPSISASRHDRDQRRATEPELYRHNFASQSQPAISSPYDPSHLSRSEPARSPANLAPPTPARSSAQPTLKPKRAPSASLNLDYMSFGTNTPPRTTQTSAPPIKTEPTNWELLLGSIDNGDSNMFNAIYGGQTADFFNERTSSRDKTCPSVTRTDDSLGLSPDIWAMTNADLGPVPAVAAPSESVLSFSTDDGNAPGNNDDWSSIEIGSGDGADWNGSKDFTNRDTNVVAQEYRGIVMPDMSDGDDMGVTPEQWNNVFGLEMGV